MKLKHVIMASLIGVSVVLLPGCPAIVVGAAGGAAASAAVYNHQNLNMVMQDDNIGNQVYIGLKNDSDIRSQCHIVVSAFRYNVLLVGQAPTEELRDRALEITKKVPGIKRIYNEITIEDPTSMTIRSKDSWITSKIKTKFLATKGLSSSQFKVITENGTVFLAGVVTYDQAALAVNIVRHIEGVNKVVKIFDYQKPSTDDTTQDASTPPQVS